MYIYPRETCPRETWNTVSRRIWSFYCSSYSYGYIALLHCIEHFKNLWTNNLVDIYIHISFKKKYIYIYIYLLKYLFIFFKTFFVGTFYCTVCNIFNISCVTLLFHHSPGMSEIQHFEIFSHPQENQPVWQFFVKFDLLLLFLIY